MSLATHAGSDPGTGASASVGVNVTTNPSTVPGATASRSTTPAASPESNGMSEAFVNTLRRDSVAGADLATAALVLEQIPAWIGDYTAVAPHSALSYQSPQQYRRAQPMTGLTC